MASNLKIMQSSLQMIPSEEFSYIHQPGKEPLMNLTLGTLLEKCSQKFSKECAIMSKEQGISLTFREVLLLSDKLAAGLSVLGLKRGDKLGIWAPNLIEWYITYLACARAGIIAVCINPGNTASEMKYCLNKVQVKALVCPHMDKHQRFFENLTEIVPELKTMTNSKINSVDVPSLKYLILISNKRVGSIYTYKDVLNMANEKDITKIRKTQNLIQPDDACNIQFSSGTTGNPKAAIQTHFGIVNNSYNNGKAFNFNSKHHKCCFMIPFFHSYGTIVGLVGALHFGNTLVLCSSNYNPEQHLRTIIDEKCTVIFGTPTMYLDLVTLQNEIKESIEIDIGVIGGAPSSNEFARQIRDVLNIKKLKVAYGLTETSGCVFLSRDTDEGDSEIFETVGHVSDHFEVKVVDEHNNVVPLGQAGELLIRGYGNIPLYYDDEEKTNELYTTGKWLRTGDQFILKKNGYGKIVGRIKDVIIRGGENIFPKEIEDFLGKHQDVLECQVIGLPHNRLGEEVCACVRLVQGSTFDLETMQQFCKDKIARFKIPSRLEIVQDFPKTESGKIKKNVLRKRFK